MNDLSKVIAVEETTDVKAANGLLSKGWILLDVSRGYYIFGYQKNNPGNESEEMK